MESTWNRERTPALLAAATELLWQLHADRVHTYARRHVGDDADDVVSETFLVAWRRLDRVPDPALPWLLGVARNVIRSRRRFERSRTGDLPEVFAMPDVADTVAEDTDLFTGLRALAPADREVLYLVGWEDLDRRSAAAVLDCSPAAFAVRLHRARRRLRHHLENPTSQRTEVAR